MVKTRIGRIMEDAHYNRIIFYLYFSGRKSKTEIYSRISTNPRIPAKLERLRDDGLIVIHEEGPAGRMRSMVELTPLGMELAEGLCRLECTLGGNVEGIRSVYGRRTRFGEFEYRRQS